MSDNPEYEAMIGGLNEALRGEGLNVHAYCYGDRSIVYCDHGCFEFTIGIWVDKGVIEVKQSSSYKDQELFNLADPGVFTEIAKYIKNYFPTNTKSSQYTTVLDETISERLDRINGYRRVNQQWSG